MPQQINLLTPILLAPRRYFSALTLLQATGLLIGVGLASAVWLEHRDRQAEASQQAVLSQYTAQRQQLLVAQANLPAPLDASALQQQLQALEAGNTQRQALLSSLGRDARHSAGQRHSDLLELVARSLPESAWITELSYAPGRLELAGGTLNTAALRPWLGQLAAHPMLAGQELSALRVDRLGAPSTESSGKPVLEQSSALAQGNLPIWAYRVVSTPARATGQASTTPGGSR